ncbi:MAG: hypothetical protein WC071_09560 [Victivallaceae bacterium]
MNPRFHNEVISKVKNTIMKMSQGKTHKVHQDNHLVKLNLPPLIGRRDAAYDQVEQLLRDNLFAHPDAERKEIYSEAVTLLEIAIKDSEYIVITLNSDESGSREKRLLSYLELLRNIVKAAAELVAYELSLFQDETNLHKFIGDSISGQLRKTDLVFSESEMSIAQNISDLLETSRPQISRYREYAIKSFGQHNAARYHRAFEEYNKLYQEQYPVRKLSAEQAR